MISLTSLTCEDQRFVYGLADPVEDARSLLSLLSHAFHRDFSYEEYEWFKLRHPFFPSRAYAAYEKATGRLASMICMRPLAYRIGGQDEVVSLAVSAATHPDFQRLGLFHKINEIIADQERREGSKYGLAFPNPFTTKSLAGFIKAGWQIPFHLSFFEKRKLKNNLSRLFSIERFDESYDDLCRIASEAHDFCHLKEHRTLNWRYMERPGIGYNCFVHKSRSVEGFIVLKKFRTADVTKTHIIDFMALNSSAAEVMISFAEHFAAGTDLLNVWLPPMSQYENLFLDAGFSSTPERFPLVLRSHEQPTIPELSSPWVVLGDFDVY
jgi:Acetyltransferase (GNAT) domain